MVGVVAFVLLSASPRLSAAVGSASATVRAALEGRLRPQAHHPHHQRSALALVGAGAEVKAGTRRAERPKPAGWFPGFAQAESTFTDEGLDAYTDQNPTKQAAEGFEVGFAGPDMIKETKSPAWFAETPSAGTEEAWQTFYPAVTGSIAGNRHVTQPTWRETPTGYVEDYVPSPLLEERSNGPGTKQAAWFDTDVLNYDGFGRPNLPGLNNDERMLDLGYSNNIWEERSVNTTIECAEIGCSANATLTAFDPATEEARNCHVSIGVHATDFDNDFENEFIQNLLVNGYVVRAECQPMAGDCTPAAQAPLYPCVTQYPVHHLLDQGSGTFNFSGSIHPMVDECPYNGNLLSGVVMVTCLVRPLSNATLANASSMVVYPQQYVQYVAVQEAFTSISCNSPGCTAAANLALNPAPVLAGGTCLMNVTINSTDFDGNLSDAPEQVNTVYFNGQVVASNLSSGVNPCNAQALLTTGQSGSGTANGTANGSANGSATGSANGTANGTADGTASGTNFALLTNHNVSQAVLAGVLSINVSISSHVDECPTAAGNLLEGIISVRCDPPPAISLNTTLPGNAPYVTLPIGNVASPGSASAATAATSGNISSAANGTAGSAAATTATTANASAAANGTGR